MDKDEEINRLRIQQQYLQEKLERFESLKLVLKRLFRLIVLDSWKKLTKRSFKTFHEYDKNYDLSFKPYELEYKNDNSNLLSNDRKVVLHIINNFKTGGASRIIVDIAEYLSVDNEHVVLTMYNPIPQNYTGIKVIEICEIPNCSQLSKLMESISPTLIHVHWGTQWGEGSVTWQWYYPIFQFFEGMDLPLIQNVNLPIVPFSVQNSSTKYVFVSEYVKKKYGFLNQDNLVIYPGSDLSLFSQEQNQGLLTKNIGMVYRLDNHKLRPESILPLIHAVLLDNEIKVHIVGDGELRSVFQEEVKKRNILDNFIFYNYLPYVDLPEIYQKMCLFVAPVFEESFGQVTPFALSMGIPVLGYNTDALPEILKDNECLVETGDFESLSKLIVQRINDSEWLKEKSIFNKKLADNYSMECMIDSYRKIYSNL